MSAPQPISIEPAHTASLADGTPVLVGAARGNGVKRRYHVMPVQQEGVLVEPDAEADTLRAPRSLTCSICSGVLVEPVAGICGHPCCRSCADGATACGKCGKPIVRVVEKKLMEWLGTGQLHSCPADGCKMTGSKSAVALHAATCGLVKVSCPREDIGCTALVPRNQLDAHAAACPFVLMSSFIAESRARIEALERDNRALRNEVRVLTRAAREHDFRWHDVRCCADCGSMLLREEAPEVAEAAESLPAQLAEQQQKERQGDERQQPPSQPDPQPDPRPQPQPECAATPVAPPRAPFPLRASLRSPYARTEEDTVETFAAADEEPTAATAPATVARAGGSSQTTHTATAIASTRPEPECARCGCEKAVPMHMWKAMRKRARVD